MLPPCTAAEAAVTMCRQARGWNSLQWSHTWLAHVWVPCDGSDCSRVGLSLPARHAHVVLCRVVCCVLCAASRHAAPDEDPDEGVGPRRDYQRGLSSCVFVPWEGVATSVLNLPTKEMDFFMTG